MSRSVGVSRVRVDRLVLARHRTHACGTSVPRSRSPSPRSPSPRALAATEPAGRVVVRVERARDLDFARADGGTVRIRGVTAVTGHLRETRADTAWIETSRLLTRGVDRPQPIPGWTVAIVTDAATRPVAIANDVVLGHRGSVWIGRLTTATALALLALTVLIGLGTHD
jgi:hypothetical protein